MIARLFIAALVFAAVAGAARAADDHIATGNPMPIGLVSHDSSPVGFTYTEAPGNLALPSGTTRGHFRHKPVPHKPVSRSASR
ncbi:MAG TPA: hypothetical protein VJ476_03680 [Rhizomicrobium sp.]|nr:hypothetical protein [Rhizomicrobium sp.]